MSSQINPEATPRPPSPAQTSIPDAPEPTAPDKEPETQVMTQDQLKTGAEKPVDNDRLPTIAELAAGDIEIFQKHSKLQILLNQPPQEAWLEPSFDKKSKSIPVGRLEFLMTAIFTRWRKEVIDTKLVANSIVVTLRVHYQDPVTKRWEWNDGIGAVPLKTEKGAAPTDFSKILDGAVHTGAPAAKAYAFKNAVKDLGVLFGRDLNREHTLDFSKLNNQYGEDGVPDTSEFTRVQED